MSTFDKYMIVLKALFVSSLLINLIIIIFKDENLTRYKKYHLYTYASSFILSVLFCIIDGLTGDGFGLIIWAACSILWLNNYLNLRKLYNK